MVGPSRRSVFASAGGRRWMGARTEGYTIRSPPTDRCEHARDKNKSPICGSWWHLLGFEKFAADDDDPEIRNPHPNPVP